MQYEDYFKKIFSEEELKLLEECYSKDSIHGLRVNLLKSSSLLIS